MSGTKTTEAILHQAEAAKALIDRIESAADGVPHDVILAALLTMVRNVAVAHPCCNQSATRGCMHVAAMLVIEASQGQTAKPSPAGAHLH